MFADLDSKRVGAASERRGLRGGADGAAARAGGDAAPDERARGSVAAGAPDERVRVLRVRGEFDAARHPRLQGAAAVPRDAARPQDAHPPGVLLAARAFRASRAHVFRGLLHAHVLVLVLVVVVFSSYSPVVRSSPLASLRCFRVRCDFSLEAAAFENENAL